MSKIINGGLDQYGTQPFEQHHFRTTGAQGVKNVTRKKYRKSYRACFQWTSGHSKVPWLATALNRRLRPLVTLEAESRLSRRRGAHLTLGKCVFHDRKSPSSLIGPRVSMATAMNVCVARSLSACAICKMRCAIWQRLGV